MAVIFPLKEAIKAFDFMRYTCNGHSIEVAINGRNEIYVSVQSVADAFGGQKSPLMAMLRKPLLMVNISKEIGIKEFAEWDDMVEALGPFGSAIGILEMPRISRMLVCEWAKA